MLYQLFPAAKTSAFPVQKMWKCRQPSVNGQVLLLIQRNNYVRQFTNLIYFELSSLSFVIVGVTVHDNTGKFQHSCKNARKASACLIFQGPLVGSSREFIGGQLRIIISHEF